MIGHKNKRNTYIISTKCMVMFPTYKTYAEKERRVKVRVRVRVRVRVESQTER